MATYYVGQTGEDVAQLQRYIARLQSGNKGIPKFAINGVYDAAFANAVKYVQGRIFKRGATGLWNDGDYKVALAVEKYYTKGKATTPYKTYPNTLANDRAWVIQQYQAIYGRAPSGAEVDNNTTLLQQGWSRNGMTQLLERLDPDSGVTKAFHDVYGREPTPIERKNWVDKLKTGKTTRAGMTQYLAGTTEALTREIPATPAEGDEDSRAVLNGMLDDLGLGGMKDWAWEEIQKGHSPTRIMQEMRQQEEYKARFRGITQRVESGLPAMSEEEYLAYEEQAEQIMRSNGLPAVFQNQAAYADLIAGNVSLSELNDRVQEGFVRVSQAPVEIRDKFAQWFGPSGDAALASFFLSKDRAIPAMREQIATAEIGGIGKQFDIDFTYQRAQQVAQAGIDKDQAREGLAQLQQLDPIFEETISEEEDLTAIDQGADAVFNLGGSGAVDIERRGRQRSAATKGGGGAAVGSGGTGLGASE
jgi:hypothetical protein